MTETLQPTRAAVGETALDLTLHDAAGSEVRLSDLWSGAPRALLLVFLRHFG